MLQAGFDEVVGIDINPHHAKVYPGTFICGDALNPPVDIMDFDFVWASPPCQAYTTLGAQNKRHYPKLINHTRQILEASGLKYAIENVTGAPLISPVLLCGTMFDGLRVKRHRIFEANFHINAPAHGEHPLVHTTRKDRRHYGKTNEWVDYVQVTGGGNCSVAAARDAMGIDWMTKRQLNQAIPPAYARFIAEHAIKEIRGINENYLPDLS